MNEKTSKRNTPSWLNRAVAPALIGLLALVMIVIFVLTALSIAGLTPGS
jgi:hypothetical protein